MITPRQKKQYQLLCKLDIDKYESKIKIKDNFASSYMFLKYISDIPDTEEYYSNDIRIYMGDVTGLNDVSSSFDDRFYIDDRRREHIKEYFKNKFVVLTPCEEKGEETTFRGQDLKVMEVKQKNDLDDNFLEVPIFSPLNTVNANNFGEFYTLLKNKNVLGKIRNPWKNGVVPEAIIWKDEYESYVFTEIDNESHNDFGMSFGMRSLNSIRMSNDWLENYYISDDVAFISKNEINGISMKINEVNDKTVNNIPATSVNNRKENEDYIFNNFKKDVLEKYNLTYDEKDLINFHNSIKSNIFTVLAGISGTGKSKIVTAYADALGLKANGTFKMISVRPFWQDDSDLLGFVDSLSNTYHPGDSGLVDTLISANKDKNSLYIIVLDEMNLARVEHYFSQFLSVLEKDSKDRKLSLYNRSLENKLYNSHLYPADLLIPENVRFVGTMNIDETTYQISDKVLDRANVITLKKVKFSDRLKVKIHENKDYDASSETSYDDFFNAIYNDEMSFSDRQLEFFDDLNECINSYLPTVGIGWRTLNSIEKFISNVNHFDYKAFNDKDALDYQVSQRVLPKIRGTRLMLNEILDDDSDNGLFALFSKYNDLSDFKFTKSMLDKKRREIEVNGFAN